MTPKSVIIILVLTFCYNNYFYVKAAENKESKNILKDLGESIKEKIPEPIKHFVGFVKDKSSDISEALSNQIDVLKKQYEKLSGPGAEINKNEEHGRRDSVVRDLLRNVKFALDKLNTKVLKKSETKDSDANNKSILTRIKDRLEKTLSESGILPGTKWCGDGDIAKHKDDLGVFPNTDRCCRAHDKCPISIGEGEEKYGLKNTGLFTRSSCECDQNFYNCLKTADNILTNEIGYAYFNLLGPQCIQIHHVQYKRRSNTNRRRVDQATYQWADNPKY